MTPLALLVNDVIVPAFPFPLGDQSPEEEEFATRNDCIWRTINGRRVCIIPKGSDAERIARAIESHKPHTKKNHAIATQMEHMVADMVGGTRTADTHAVDVLVKLDNKLHAVEVKTMIHNANDKITMHPASLRRKEAWTKRNRAETHTVVVDVRSGTRKMYYRRGIGSFRLNTLEQVGGAPHLKQLMRAKK